MRKELEGEWGKWWLGQSTVSRDTTVVPREELLGTLRAEQLVPLGTSRKVLGRGSRLGWVGLEIGVAFQAERIRGLKGSPEHLGNKRLRPFA